MAEDDALTATRLDVAEMKGMLKQALGDLGQRTANLETDTATLHARLSDKGKALATHTEKIAGLEKAVHDLESDNSARMGKVLGAIAGVVGIAGLAVALFNAVTLH